MHVVHVGNGAVFAESENLRGIRCVLELVECARVAGMVVCAVVYVDGENVVVFAARIPGGDGRTFGVEHPDHVLHALDLYHAVKYQAVEGCELVARIDAPPEPLAARFVQGAKNACDTIFLQFEEVVGDVVDVGDDTLVGGTFGVPFGSAGLESGREVKIRVFAAVGRTLDIEGVLFVERVFPVPGECGNAASLP